MLEKLLGTFPDVIQMLRDDHQLVRRLFAKYAQADGAEKAQLAKQVIRELDIHAGLEERLIYPAFRKVFKDPTIIDEGVEEHHLVHVLLKELKKLKPGHEPFNAKFTVLRELVKHHVDEEEGRMFPKAEAHDLDWAALCRDARALKRRLTTKAAVRRSAKARAQAA